MLGVYVSCTPAYAEVIELDPASKWVMKYDDDSCSLQKLFGEEDNPVYLELRRFAPETPFRVSIYTEAFLSERDRSFDLTFVPGGETREIWAMGLGNRRGEPRGFVFNAELTPSDIDDVPEQALRSREAEVQGLLLEGAFRDDLLLRTGSLGAPMKAMRACTSELLSHWGIDAEAHENLTREAAISNRSRVVDELVEYYSREARWEGRQAWLSLRIDVSAAGEPTGCHLQDGWSDDSFKDHVCEAVIQVASFTPALDASGSPVASYWTVQTVFMIE